MTNSITNLANNPSQGTTTAAADTISDVARQKTTNVLKDNGRIVQTERLFSARARYAAEQETQVDGRDLAGDRGTRAYIKLITSKKQSDAYVKGNTDRKITYKELIGSDSIVSKMTQTGGGFASLGYDEFLLTGVSCDMNEKVQITEVFGDGEVIYYFGRQPLIFNLRGVLIDSIDNDWFINWVKTYSEFLRGTQAAKNYELIKIVLPTMAITGSIAAFNWAQDSSRDTDIAFSIQFIAKIIEPIPVSKLGAAISSPFLKGVNFSAAGMQLSTAQINSLKGQVASLNGVISDPTASLRTKAAALGTLGSGTGGMLGGFMDTSKNTLNGVQSTIEGWNKTLTSGVNSVRTSALFQTVTSTLNGIRTNLFSPVYGILSSLTKLVSNAFNSATSLFNSVINPVRNILKDITNISNQAIALVNLVNNSITGFGRNVNSQLRGVREDYKLAIKTLGKAAGTVATAPISAANATRNMFKSGALLSTSAFLTSTPKLTFVRPSLTILKRPVPSIADRLLDVPEFSSKVSNKL